MPAIYSEQWYQAMVELANSQDDISRKVPQGEWNVVVEVVGDGQSPYVPKGVVKNFLIRFVDGKVAEYKESSEKIQEKGLNYRIRGPASVFEGIAAGILDPIEVGLNGTITIRGDMRFLMQHADLVNVIFGIYTRSGVTEWDKGKPPYQ
jgi:putative sterol carrier protein